MRRENERDTAATLESCADELYAALAADAVPSAVRNLIRWAIDFHLDSDPCEVERAWLASLPPDADARLRGACRECAPLTPGPEEAPARAKVADEHKGNTAPALTAGEAHSLQGAVAALRMLGVRRGPSDMIGVAHFRDASVLTALLARCVVREGEG
jgi:hypothetical protein